MAEELVCLDVMANVKDWINNSWCYREPSNFGGSVNLVNPLAPWSRVMELPTHIFHFCIVQGFRRERRELEKTENWRREFCLILAIFLPT